MKKVILFVSLLCASSVTVCMEHMEDSVFRQHFMQLPQEAQKYVVQYVSVDAGKWLSLFACKRVESGIIAEAFGTSSDIAALIWPGYVANKGRNEYWWQDEAYIDVYGEGGRSRYLSNDSSNEMCDFVGVMGSENSESVHIAKDKNVCVEIKIGKNSKKCSVLQTRWIPLLSQSIPLQTFPISRVCKKGATVSLSADDAQCIVCYKDLYALYDIQCINADTIEKIDVRDALKLYALFKECEKKQLGPNQKKQIIVLAQKYADLTENALKH